MLTNQKGLFQLPDEICYLNCAYMSPMPKQVLAASQKGIEQKLQPFRIKPNDFFDDTEEVRKTFARLIDVAEPKRIVSIAAASYGTAVVANNTKISKGENIVLVEEQFPSNVYTWRRLAKERDCSIKTISAPATQENRAKIWNERILDAIDSHTRLVALPHVHWADGTKFDLLAIRKRSRDVGALLVIDGTQSVGALPFSVKEIQPDALVCAGYKWLMSPYSTGLAYFGEAFDGGVPIEENWINRYKSEDFANLVNYSDDYQPYALRYEVGEHSNFILLPMMLAALQLIESWGIQDIQDYCQHITEKPLQTLSEYGFSLEDAAYRGHHLFGVRLPETLDVASVKTELEKNQIFVSVRGSAIRVSPHLYNDVADVEKLVHVLVGLVK